MPRPEVTGKKLSELTPFAIDGSQTAEEFRIENRISKSTWNRLRARGDHPTLTWITSQKFVIRRRHGLEWLDRRMSRPGDEAA